jgi:hypothetical protein
MSDLGGPRHQGVAAFFHALVQIRGVIVIRTAPDSRMTLNRVE